MAGGLCSLVVVVAADSIVQYWQVILAKCMRQQRGA